MFYSKLHSTLKECLGDITWTRSTRDEDNFRQVLCSALYKHIAPDNIQIPSTRSGGGDLVVFGRKIELKYASNEKPEHLSASLIRDFERLMKASIEFFLFSVRLDPCPEDEFVHQVLAMPMLNATKYKHGFGSRKIDQHSYMYISILLAAVYPHEVRPISPKNQPKNATGYMSFESAGAISRSSFLKTPLGLIHVDVVGSKEDGLLSFLFKRADCASLVTKANSHRDIFIPHSLPIKIGECELVDAFAQTRKEDIKDVVSATPLAQEVPCFKLYWSGMPTQSESQVDEGDQVESSSESVSAGSATASIVAHAAVSAAH